MTVGVYKITNTKNNKVYIGSSKDIDRRFKEHLYKMQNNSHHSSKLQRSYNKASDKSIFIFETIEETTEDKLKEREQYYIDYYDSFNNGYNCCAEVDNPKYSLKNIKTEINKQKLDTYYNEFMDLYENNKSGLIIGYGKKFLNRLLSKYYKYQTYKTMNIIIKWFLENYNIDNYSAKIIVNTMKQYYLVIIDKDNIEIENYNLYKGKLLKQ